ncbi:MAG TPA: Tim44-like domain-containing protein [Herbaspirillum sp.]|jgi:predicted lipid-binding transport protein (Tim44 family)
MKKVFIALFVAVLTLSAGIPDAEARRMGGGGSFGKQSQKASRPTPPQNQMAAPAKPAAAPAAAGPAAGAKPSPWKGILGGALLGLGLGALLSSMGMGGALASMISTMLMVGLIATVAMLAYRWYKRRTGGVPGSTPAFANTANAPGAFPTALFPKNSENRMDPAQPASLQHASEASAGSSTSNMTPGGVAASGLDTVAGNDTEPWGVPADFDTQGFLRHAKTYFIRLQAAWDKADVNDISEFTTPEMFAEIKMQIQERGAAANHTDVMALDAELLGIDTVNNDYLASVKFSGMIKEDANTPTAAFSEVWNLSKPVSGSGGWTLAGIQQQLAA